MRLPSARGLILEELVLRLLTQVGYRIVEPGEEGTQQGHAGLEVQGRGEWHQIDALAAFDRTPAFMYPLRLLVEAKCYARGRPVGIEVARNAVGVLKDISENFFTYAPTGLGSASLQVQRFNYHAAIFSTSSYTAGAQRFAIAHQIFLIQYERVPLLRPVIEGLLALRDEHFAVLASNEVEVSARLRVEVRRLFEAGEVPIHTTNGPFSAIGLNHFREHILGPLRQIEGSYFGMLQGRWPMHLLSRRPLPQAAFLDRDEVLCRVFGRDSDRWSFAPVDAQEGDPAWFRLEFDIPAEAIGLVQAARGDALAMAAVKQQNFSFLDLIGQIGGIQRQVRLRLDEVWLVEYLDRVLGRGSQQ